MSLLSGLGKISGVVGAVGDIINSVFPDRIIIRGVDDGKEIMINSVENIQRGRSVTSAKNPSEDQKTFLQNIYRNPKTISLTGILSNILTLSDLNSLSEATKYASSLLIPEVAGVTNLFLNETDSVTERLSSLENYMNTGAIVQILGIPEQTVFNYTIQSISDNESEETGVAAKSIDIELEEAFIPGLEIAGVAGGKFANITEALPGLIPDAIGGIF